ncbi:MAG: hypothetical protein V1823_02245 [Chloroflexota bacterium]
MLQSAIRLPFAIMLIPIVPIVTYILGFLSGIPGGYTFIKLFSAIVLLPFYLIIMALVWLYKNVFGIGFILAFLGIPIVILAMIVLSLLPALDEDMKEEKKYKMMVLNAYPYALPPYVSTH